MSPFWLTELAVGIIIIIVLASYAAKLLGQLKDQNTQQIQQQKEHALALQQHDIKVLKSITIIAKAMQAEQCDFSEGCWRLSVLIDSLKLSEQLNQQFPAIFELYGKIKHMPILGDRKKLSKTERMKFDLERMKAEAQLNSKIQNDIGLLLQYSNERISVLNQ